MKQLLLLLLTICCLSSHAYQRSICHEGETMVIEYDFSDLILHKDSITNATSISLPGFSSTFLPNHPILPRKTENVEIPSTYRVANITYSAQQDTIIGHCAVAPARITNSKTQTIEMLADAQSTNKVIWPSKIIEWNKSNTYRDLQFASIILTPIRCNTETGHIYILRNT